MSADQEKCKNCWEITDEYGSYMGTSYCEKHGTKQSSPVTEKTEALLNEALQRLKWCMGVFEAAKASRIDMEVLNLAILEIELKQKPNRGDK